MVDATPRCFSDGPQPAKILIVGEAPGAEEIGQKKPFVGASGKELTSMLHSVDILRTECRITNVCPWRPPRNDISKFFFTKSEAAKRALPEVGGKYPNELIRKGLEELCAEVAKTRPEVIIAFGNTALWALTGEWGITKWRGSALKLSPVWEGPYDPNIRVIPTYHPAAILRSWDWRSVACYDLSKATKPPVPEPKWNWNISEDPKEILNVLSFLHQSLDEGKITWLSADIETRERQFIDCIGLAWSENSAITIPFFKASDYSFLYTPEQEADIILLLRSILLHPNVKIIGQNWYYDAQYISRLWGFLVTPAFDTMVAHAVAYPGTPKALDYLSSIYLPWHRYWKDDTSEAEATANDLKRWEYNCKDCCATWALRAPIEATIGKYNLEKPLAFELSLFRPLLAMMMKGVRQNEALKNQYLPRVMEQQSELECFFNEIKEKAFPDIILAKSKTAKPWYRSPTQMVKLFYEEFLLPVQYNKHTKRPTTDDKALDTIAKKEKVFAPLIYALQDYRSLGVFLSTFLLMPTDRDKRFRTSYNPVGTETFRFNSSSDPFGYGGNLQNIPAGGDD